MKQTTESPVNGLPDFLATALALQHMPGLNREGRPVPRPARRVARSRVQSIAPTGEDGGRT